MNSAVQNPPHRSVPAREEADQGVGFLVVEQRSTTPLGPRIVYVNDELSKLSGYDSRSLVGSPLGLLYDRSDLSALINKLPAIAARSTHCFMDRPLVRNGGTRVSCRWTIRFTNREGEPQGHFALTVRPSVSALPETKLPEEVPAPVAEPAKAVELPSSEATLRDYETARTESISLAAAGVAHDFKNALQAIKTNLELAALANPGTSSVRSHIAEAQIALDDAEILARQMLAFTRGDHKRRSVIRIGNLLERVSRLCSAGSGIRCRLFLADSLSCIEGDPVRIYQVLHNLVINARQAMPTGGTIDLVADNAEFGPENPFVLPAGRYVVISVRDKGCGIPKADLPRIFEPSYSTKAGGSGIGLASCFSIVQAHRGAIRVASEVGVGTEFLVFLPTTDLPPEADPTWVASKPAAPQLAPRTQSASGRVLVVEDEPCVARSTMGLLKQLGYDTLHARNGQEAISLYRGHLDSPERIDVVLLDMTLPGGIPGREVASEIRRLEPDARIVATSGYFEEGSERTLAGEFSGILPKPYGMEDLFEALESAVV